MTVEWNGPPPPENSGPGKFSPYPFKNWKVGDTESFPADEYKQIRAAVGNLNRKDKKTKRSKWHFRYAKVTEEGAERVRVWRDK